MKPMLTVLIVAMTIVACSLPTTSAPSRATVSARQFDDGGSIEPDARGQVRAMCDHLTAMKAFSIKVHDWTDEVLESGQKIQYSHRRTAILSRPDKLWTDARGDQKNRTFWKEGTSLTFASHEHQVYGQVDVPSTIDDTVDFLIETYDMFLPLADLLSADPYSLFTENVKSGFVVGMSQVQGHDCHHLAFTQDNVDWQIWIDAGADPLPRQIVIDYKQLESRPQYMVVFDEFRALDKIDASTFHFEAPDGYEQIEVMKLAVDVTDVEDSGA